MAEKCDLLIDASPLQRRSEEKRSPPKDKHVTNAHLSTGASGSHSRID